MSDNATTAVLFDIDGTLVDSNYLHVDAWDRAFDEIGHPVATWRIHRAIGMDSDSMIGLLLGEHDSADVSAEVKKFHDRFYAAASSRLRLIPDARELLHELAQRGYTVILATSAPAKELAVLLALLDVADEVDVVTSGDDVDTAKPAPDIIEVALQRAAVEPADAVMIGDSVWDVEGARRAGVACIGVLTGGYAEQELRDAGAIDVYPSVSELLDALDQILRFQRTHAVNLGEGTTERRT